MGVEPLSSSSLSLSAFPTIGDQHPRFDLLIFENKSWNLWGSNPCHRHYRYRHFQQSGISILISTCSHLRTKVGNCGSRAHSSSSLSLSENPTIGDQSENEGKKKQEMKANEARPPNWYFDFEITRNVVIFKVWQLKMIERTKVQKKKK